MTPNCSVGMDDSAKEEVPVTLGATTDGTDADLVCSIMSTGDELTPLPGVGKAFAHPTLVALFPEWPNKLIFFPS